MVRITHTHGRRAPAVEQFAFAPIRIGSAPGADIAFAAALDPGVAPHHAEIRFEDGAYYVVDLGSPFGTFVQGVRVAKQPLRHFDHVALGGPHGPAFRVELLGAPIASRDAMRPDAEGRVDVATAQRLVEEVVVRVAAGADGSAALVAQRVAHVKRRAARLNALLGAGVAAAFVATAIGVVAAWRSRRAAEVLAAEAGLGRKQSAAPAGTIPTEVLSGRAIYERNKGALYVMGYVDGNRVGGCCSAFAIAPNLLATNAHCVLSCGRRKGTPIVTKNESSGSVRLRIVASRAHPDYRHESRSADSPDVGLLRVDGTMTSIVTLASDAELRAIGPGDDAYVLGFPGRVMDPVSPSATFLQGRVGRVMGFDQKPAEPEKAMLVQHDAVTRGGNSGSPIFNQYGHVIAVHAAHVDDEDDVSIDGKKTTVVGASPFRLGMRVDLLRGVPPP